MSEKTPYRDGLPGYRQGAPATSRAAAVAISEKAKSIRARCREVVTLSGSAGVTADRVASALDLNVYQVRARLSELHAAREIAESGRRERGASGLQTTVWVSKEFAPPDPDDAQGDLLDAA